MRTHGSLFLCFHTISLFVVLLEGPPAAGQTSPTREYIRLGDRVVAIELPAQVPAPLAPSAYIDLPASGAVLFGTNQIAGWAIDNATRSETAIQSLKILVDGVVVSTNSYGVSRPDVCTAYPGRPLCPNVGFGYLWNTTQVSDGTHTIRIEATDSDTVPKMTALERTVQVANANQPSVFIDLPASGAVLFGTNQIAGWAIDNATRSETAIQSLKILVDGVVVSTNSYGVSRPDVCAAYPGRPLCPSVGFGYLWNTTQVSDGTHTIRIEATDSDTVPKMTALERTVQVANANQPPIFVSLTPSSGSGATVTERVTYSDANGANDITNVLGMTSPSLDTYAACYWQYVKASNTFQIANDAGLWAGSVPANGSPSSILSNSYCTITGPTVSTSGNQVTAAVPITYTAGLTGNNLKFWVMGWDATTAGQTNWTQAGTWAVGTDVPPTISSLSPTSGTGVQQSFTLTVSDGNGVANLRHLRLNVNTQVSSLGGCYVIYRPPNNTFYLVGDPPGYWLPLGPNSTDTVSNSQCTLLRAGSSASGSGNTASMTANLLFKPAFSGPKTVYVETDDNGGLETGFVQMGTWTVGNLAPTLGQVTPSAGSGSAGAFTLTAADGNGYGDIRTLALKFLTTNGTATQCIITRKSDGSISLTADDGATYLPLGPNTPDSTQNSQCVLYRSGTTVSGSGNNLSVTANVAFKTSFISALMVYGLADDQSAATTNWQYLGSWTATASGANGAHLVSTSIPSNVPAGSAFQATIVMQNNGTRIWDATSSQPHELGAWNPPFNATWGAGLTGVILPTPTVAPGATATFAINATAPTSPGTYHFTWRMTQLGVEEWFGDVADATITVTPINPITVTVAPSSATMNCVTPGSFSAAVFNTSNTGVTWQITGVPNPSLYASLSSTTANPTTVSGLCLQNQTGWYVTAASNANTAVTGSSAVTLYAGTSPPHQQLAAGQQVWICASWPISSVSQPSAGTLSSVIPGTDCFVYNAPSTITSPLDVLLTMFNVGNTQTAQGMMNLR